MIIPPSPEKTPPHELKYTWELASSILLNSFYLIVFGFAFNLYDEAVLTLLKNSGVNLRSVLLVDINPQMEIAHKIWPHAIITSSMPPPNGDKTIATWLVENVATHVGH